MKYKWFDSKLSFEKRVELLLKAMTPEEKASQLLHTARAIPRLGIPAYTWWNEVLHGVARAGRATVFPQSIGLACTFDPESVEKMGRAAALEGRAKRCAARKNGNDQNIYFGLSYWTPNINIFRDPRWGRGQETYGEDPFLTGEIGSAMVRGLQGKNRKYLLSAACAKHFWGHSGPEALRHAFNAKISKRDAVSTYLPAFEKLVKEAHVAGVMGAYNRTNGEVCCGSAKFIRELLRKEWGFQGYFVSDCGAIMDICNHHKVAKDQTSAAALALKNGCNVNCGCAYEKLMDALKKGMITEAELDEAVRYSMMIRMRLGLFDPDEKVPHAKTPESVIECAAHRNLARKLAAESGVLLKNNGILPLAKDAIGYEVQGPNARALPGLWGNYNGFSGHFVTPLEGIVHHVSAGTYVADQALGGEIYAAIQKEPAEIPVLYFAGLNEKLEGEEGGAGAGGDRVSLDLPKDQRRELDELYRAGRRVVLVVITGGAVDLSKDMKHAEAILYLPYPGEEGGNAAADLLFGDVSPSGRLPVTFPVSTADLPPMEDYSMKGRTYRFLEKKPLFPFGYGLSYVKFRYGAPAKKKTAAGFFMECSVKNTGKMRADEVVQLYLRFKGTGMAVPNCELAGFQRITLQPGETRKVRFELPKDKVFCVTEDGEKRYPAGAEMEFFIGGDSSLNAPVSGTFNL